MIPFPGRLQAGLPPYSPVFKSWIHCWKYLSMQVSKLPQVVSCSHTSRSPWFCGCFIAWKDRGLPWNPVL